jgi:hypothetical protein
MSYRTAFSKHHLWAKYYNNLTVLGSELNIPLDYYDFILMFLSDWTVCNWRFFERNLNIAY